jgi:2-polyprenyl-3-methyl-5-hydroxy-6-metoxy-1,4-benzoquinol methylase
LETELRAERNTAGHFQTNAAHHLSELTTELQRQQLELTTLTERLFAIPYMSRPDEFLITSDDGEKTLGYSLASPSPSRSLYLDFEDVFRGSEDLIRERLRVYVPLLEGRAHVVDIGCGRGEMLDLLGEAGAATTGIDVDASMVAHCARKGHSVERADALSWLESRAERSVPAIFTAQVIEHLTFDDLLAFFDLCRTRLTPGGVLIAETVNPHSLEAFKTFFTDLTHQRPIFPEVALALSKLTGFQSARILFPLGKGDVINDRRSCGAYAIVAMTAP